MVIRGNVIDFKYASSLGISFLFSDPEGMTQNNVSITHTQTMRPRQANNFAV